jgi:nucleoid-associated protein YgaU
MVAVFQTLPAIAKKGPQLVWLLGMLSLFWAAPAHSQSLGDIARQERQRKEEQPPPPATHVYDNDDLARRQILLPEDKARFEASKQEVKPAESKPAIASAAVEVKRDAIPLGDIARQERQRKQNQAPLTPHVYNNADLARPQILLPEDRERFVASRQKVRLAASEPAVQSAHNESDNNSVPLGDMARRYRALEEVRKSSEEQSGTPLPILNAPILAYPTFSRPAVEMYSTPVPRRSAKMKKAPPGEAIARAGLQDRRSIRIQAGDTLWELANKYLGHGKSWLVLVAYNPQLTDPRRIQIGSWVRLPAESPKPPPTRRVRVELGDSLWKLAQDHFGSGGAWGCIARVNPQLENADLLFPGQELTMPEECANPFPLSRGERVSLATSGPNPGSW